MGDIVGLLDIFMRFPFESVRTTIGFAPRALFSANSATHYGGSKMAEGSPFNLHKVRKFIAQSLAIWRFEWQSGTTSDMVEYVLKN